MTLSLQNISTALSGITFSSAMMPTLPALMGDTGELQVVSLPEHIPEIAAFATAAKGVFGTRVYTLSGTSVRGVILGPTPTGVRLKLGVPACSEECVRLDMEGEFVGNQFTVRQNMGLDQSSVERKKEVEEREVVGRFSTEIIGETSLFKRAARLALQRRSKFADLWSKVDRIFGQDILSPSTALLIGAIMAQSHPVGGINFFTGTESQITLGSVGTEPWNLLGSALRRKIPFLNVQSSFSLHGGWAEPLWEVRYRRFLVDKEITATISVIFFGSFFVNHEEPVRYSLPSPVMRFLFQSAALLDPTFPLREEERPAVSIQPA